VSVPLGARAPLSSKPWFAAFVALVVGLLAGLIVPQGTAERQRLGPFAARLGVRFKAGVRRFTDRSISEGLGRR